MDDSILKLYNCYKDKAKSNPDLHLKSNTSKDDLIFVIQDWILFEVQVQQDFSHRLEGKMLSRKWIDRNSRVFQLDGKTYFSEFDSRLKIRKVCPQIVVEKTCKSKIRHFDLTRKSETLENSVKTNWWFCNVYKFDLKNWLQEKFVKTKN